MLVLTKVHTAQDPRTHIQCQIASTASAGTARKELGGDWGCGRGGSLACLLPSLAAHADGGSIIIQYNGPGDRSTKCPPTDHTLTVRHAASRAESATRRVGLNFTIAVILLVALLLVSA